MVAAYLVGTRGTRAHAVALGLTVTVTHTIGVFALGLVTLALSQYVLPEDLYPWLNLASGCSIVGVGAASCARARARGARGHHATTSTTTTTARHHHDRPSASPPAASLAMGASAGLIPCPSALVVLLGAVAQHQVALGLVLIVAFSAGLAATLVALGLAVVTASGRITRRIGATGRIATIAPAVSAVAIVAVGLASDARAPCRRSRRLGSSACRRPTSPRCAAVRHAANAPAHVTTNSPTIA
jgi:ABC-type nickel/cobalt efflux system permease component RcnA